MLVTRYRNPIVNRSRSLDLFHEFFHSLEDQGTKEVFDFTPAVNTREGEEAYHIDVDLPGINKEDVEISIDKNILTISGKREVKEEVKKEEDYYRIESKYGSFSRSFTLPKKVDVENIKATSDNGVLEVIIPKLKVLKDETKKIEIQ